MLKKLKKLKDKEDGMMRTNGKDQYGHKAGTKSEKIDQLLMAGTNRKQLEDENVQWSRFMAHIAHLRRRHGVMVVKNGETYLIKTVGKVQPTVDVEVTKPEVDSDGYIKPAIYGKAKRAVEAGMTPIIFGPAGSGKSRMAKEIAKDIGKEFHTMSFSGGLRYSQVFGSQTLKDGDTKWVPAPLLEWVQTECLILLDEIFSADPDVLLGLNSLLEPDTRCIATPIGMIRVHPKCSFVAAANSNGRQQSRQYTGATRSDDSLLDRLIPPFYMDYDPVVEESIARRMVDEESATFLVRTLQELRRQIKEKGIGFDPSTRRLIGACKLVGAGFTTTDAFRLSFMSTLSQAEVAQVNPLN